MNMKTPKKPVKSSVPNREVAKDPVKAVKNKVKRAMSPQKGK